MILCITVVYPSLQKDVVQESDAADEGGKTSLMAARENPSMASRHEDRVWMLSFTHSLACLWLAARLKLKDPDPSWYKASPCEIRDEQPRPWMESSNMVEEGWRSRGKVLGDSPTLRSLMTEAQLQVPITHVLSP